MPRDSKTRPQLIDRIRERLFAELGNECAEASDECDGPLQIDHPYGRAHWARKPHQVNSYQRWLTYQREHEQGLVRLLCRYHNETIRPRANRHDDVDAPF